MQGVLEMMRITIVPWGQAQNRQNGQSPLFWNFYFLTSPLTNALGVWHLFALLSCHWMTLLFSNSFTSLPGNIFTMFLGNRNTLLPGHLAGNYLAVFLRKIVTFLLSCWSTFLMRNFVAHRWPWFTNLSWNFFAAMT